MTWSLFYRFENEVPTDFHELRQFGNSLWTANGKVKTMGHSMVTEFASPQAAKDALAQRGNEIEVQGYKRVRQCFGGLRPEPDLRPCRPTRHAMHATGHLSFKFPSKTTWQVLVAPY
ncbi:hypothetical protein IB278_33330 [Variovorax sp. VRV01]|uniref:hypothetical protein n=1 Tax=Variovorax sp. VRV01 TaxID=2769259 RepID=UPI00178775FA|nr:hypothetical protein [Variovorax sp. VRV01]MBD9668849.1 hypothetical protein [Variovorax sp. VRV01]